MEKKAKFTCETIIDYGDKFQEVSLVPNNEDDDEFTTTKVTMNILQPYLGFFRPGRNYEMCFTELKDN